MLEYPKGGRGLPFWDTANTYFFDNDYDVACPAGYADEAGGKVRARMRSGGPITRAPCCAVHVLLRPVRTHALLGCACPAAPAADQTS